MIKTLDYAGPEYQCLKNEQDIEEKENNYVKGNELVSDLSRLPYILPDLIQKTHIYCSVYLIKSFRLLFIPYFDQDKPKQHATNMGEMRDIVSLDPGRA